MSSASQRPERQVPDKIDQQVDARDVTESWWGWKGSGNVALALTSFVIILAFS